MDEELIEKLVDQLEEALGSLTLSQRVLFKDVANISFRHVRIVGNNKDAYIKSMSKLLKLYMIFLFFLEKYPEEFNNTMNDFANSILRRLK